MHLFLFIFLFFCKISMKLNIFFIYYIYHIIKMNLNEDLIFKKKRSFKYALSRICICDYFEILQ